LALSPFMTMNLEFPISCRLTRECSGICPLNVYAELRLPLHGSIGKFKPSWGVACYAPEPVHAVPHRAGFDKNRRLSPQELRWARCWPAACGVIGAPQAVD